LDGSGGVSVFDATAGVSELDGIGGVSVRLTDPEGFLVSTGIISTLVSRLPSLEDL
jgi:hypothetical protein